MIQFPSRRFLVAAWSTLSVTGCTQAPRVPENQAIVGTHARTSTVVGDLRLHEFTSHVFGNTRTLRVLVPEGYDAPANRHRRYPVLYLNDGQNLFDARVAAWGVEWHVDETVKILTEQGRVPPMLIVGIDNAGQGQRAIEYLPYSDGTRESAVKNRGTAYPSFLVDEVVPFINEHYRTVHDPKHTGLGGSSYGATAALYTAIARPGVFGRLLVESPQIHLDQKHLFRDAAAVHQWPARISLGVGTNEGDQAVCPPATSHKGLVDEVLEFAETLRRAGADSSGMRVVVDPCARHNEDAWGRRLPDALIFLFGAH